MSAKAGKRPLRSLTAHEKLDAIRRVHDGESKASVARDIGVPESTLRGWCKNEDKISYLSRQSSPDTDESLEHSASKRQKLVDDTPMQPFNLSLKSNGSSYSPTSGIDYTTKTDAIDATAVKTISNGTKETLKSTSNNHSMSERERNRAELARLSVELGLNRPEMFLPSLNSASANLADLTANINLLAQWNSLLMQKTQQQQQQLPQTNNKNKVTSPADTTMVTSTGGVGGGLLTTVDQDKSSNKMLPKEKQSVHESVWYWLKTQQSMLGMNPPPVSAISNLPTPASLSPPTTSASNNTTSTPFLNGASPDQSSWFWKWYKQFAYNQQIPQLSQDTNKPILYQQLTKEAAPPPPQKLPSPLPPVQVQPPVLMVADQQNAENLSMHDDKQQKTADKVNNNNNSSKARSVLDNLLFNNNNNVAVNRKDGKDTDEDLSQSEAVEHGEKFLKWLEACSDPSVTAMQIMQFRTLLNNVKSGADRRNGDLQNKTKVKRK